jgi:hypothetical protein
VTRVAQQFLVAVLVITTHVQRCDVVDHVAQLRAALTLALLAQAKVTSTDVRSVTYASTAALALDGRSR